MPGRTKPFPYKNHLHPKFWPTWFGLGLLWLACQLPYPWLMALGRGLGLIGFYLLPERRRITRTNMRLCFPELDRKATRRLVKQNFQSSSLALFESGLAWWGSNERLRRLYRVEGLENLQAAESQGKGVLLLGGHYTTLEISGRFVQFNTPELRPTYKRAHNALFEAVMAHARSKTHGGLISSRDMRATLKALKNKKIVWYAPDQDFGLTSSVFAPFMGIQTATLTLTARIAKASGAPMIDLYSERLPNKEGYLIRFGPVVEKFPSGDDIADATRVNQIIEAGVRRAPEQYLWGHRRFKTRPRGEPQLYAIRRNKYMRRYTLLLAILGLPIIFYTLWQSIRARDKRYLLQRLGLSLPPVQAPLWIHAASVGEVNAIIPLLGLLNARHPEISLLLTTNTPSGQLTAQNKVSDIAHCGYLPVDWRWSSTRFINTVQPCCALIVETEIWPNIYEYCYYKGIRIIIVNGRLSTRSTQAPFTIRYGLSQAIHQTYAILPRSEEDAKNFISLGADTDFLTVTGNIKYAVPHESASCAIELGRPFILAASTRDGEEKQLVLTWNQIAGAKPLLVIVPRHPKRLPKILSDIAPLCKHIAVRSKRDPVTRETEIYIADTFGELSGFITASEFVIMGGSFGPFGGQNIIEVGRQAKAVIFGPHMDNFKDEAQSFLQHEAAIQVSDNTELDAAINRLLSDPDYRRQLGQNGRQLTTQFANVVDDYFVEISRLCPLLQKN